MTLLLGVMWALHCKYVPGVLLLYSNIGNMIPDMHL